MVVFRRAMLALLLVAASAGCTSASAPDGPATASPSTPRASSTPPVSASTSPARPSVPSSASSAPRRMPPVSAQAHAAGLIDIRTIVPDAIVDLRYATSDNFVGVRLYPADARCLVHESMAAGLTAAANRLRRDGKVLVFWDCYRPHAVQVHMFQIVPDPNWVARPGPFATSHEAARSVDVTLAHAATNLACPPAQRVQLHCLLEMGTGFDDFSPRAHAFATDGVSPQAQANRTLLRAAMNDGGITVYSGEWWHFDGSGADVQRPHLNVPVN
ncbi:MAG: zinc D-Ala-D-Ala dipeptidase [Pseudonocardiales bacterium]|nr:zinc D-Ala-D-Ala dipeptidase [Pseudonocardiales bacterium]MDT4977809.1 zinc D-Ala-D-Ala dipeptidase [Pseudonocardiales bacterium]